MLRVLALALALLTTPALAGTCDTTTEEAINAAIQSEPQRLVKVLEGAELMTFISKLQSSGYMTGTLPAVDRIYIVDAGKLEGYTTDNVWLFFVQDGCLLGAIPATKSIIMELL